MEFNLRHTHLEDDLIKIVPLEETDFGRLFLVASDPFIWEQNPAKDKYKLEVFKQYFDGAVKSNSEFLIYDKKTDEIIGSTRYYDYNPEKSNVSIGFTFLARSYWGGSYNKVMKKLLMDYAFKFVNEHKYLPAANAETRLKHKYIGALSCNDEEVEQKLNSALELAVQLKNNKLHLKISSSLWEYYAKVQNYEKAIIQYLNACRQIKKILISIPEEFRIKFINSKKILPYFNTLVSIKQDYFKHNDYSFTKYHCINNDNELKDFFKELDKITSDSG